MLLLLLQSPRVYPVTGIGAGVSASLSSGGVGVALDPVGRAVTVTPVQR